MAESNKFYSSLKLPFIILVIMWIVQVIQSVLYINLGSFGILPRTIDGLKGIFFTPFIHSSHDWMHIINNSVPLFVCMAIILYFYRNIAYSSIFLIYVLTGLAVWLFARSVYHVGASGVVYGLVAFIFWNGIFRRNIKSIVLSLFIIFMYSGMLIGILPQQPGISWESHLMGGLVGVLVSYIYKGAIEEDEAPIELEDEEPSDFFLNRDTFLLTKKEREEVFRSNWHSNNTWGSQI